MNVTREDQVQQIKDCGQSIVDHAESIYGDYLCSASLTVVITMDVNEPPVITVNWYKGQLEGLILSQPYG